MHKVKKHIVLFVLSFFFSLISYSQCAMCRAVLESEEGQGAAKGINDGIIYLMIIPYLLVGGFGYMIYHKFFRSKKS
jgi:hypothetical protein